MVLAPIILHSQIIRGRVIDENNKPLQFATVTLKDANIQQTTDAAGGFKFDLSFNNTDSVSLTATYTGKAAATVTLYKNQYAGEIRIKLITESLTLQKVEIVAVRKNENSVSSIVFDQEAIRQSQAFSLMDVLNNLPGRKTSAPNLQSPETLTMRTAATGNNAMNNSFGIAIYVDGIRVNKDANMQARGVSQRGTGSSGIAPQGGSTFDVAFNGFDLRDIPIENIERIEIIQGVASARYDEMTSGAILITTKAGKGPYNFNVNINGGSTGFSLSKGWGLGKKLGAINMSAGYLHSNADLRDRIKSYGRLNTSMAWSVNVSGNIKNTFSFSFDKRIDNVKLDPDDDSEKMTYAKGHNFSVANRSDIQLPNRIVERIGISASYASGYQDSYTQWLLNQPPKGIAGKDTMGVYEGYWVPGNYLAVEQIKGKPVSINGNADAYFKRFRTLNLSHYITGGFSIYASGNIGDGLVIDPDRPRFSNLGGQNLRPYSFKDSVQFATNWGVYMQDNISGKLFNKPFAIGLGIRYNKQNTGGNVQPRISARYTLNKKWSISTAYGLSTKAPSLAQLYPGNTYFDIPLLNLYSGYEATSLYLVYTHKMVNDKNLLQAARTHQSEAGLNYQAKAGNGSMLFYYKKNNLGFTDIADSIRIIYPVYDYRLSNDNSIVYFPTGRDSAATYSRRIITNNLSSKDYGIEVMFQTLMIKSISTNFSLRGAYALSYYKSNITNKSITYQSNDGTEIKASFPVEQLNRSQLITNLTTNTHIPSLGFVVSVIADVDFFNKSEEIAVIRNSDGYMMMGDLKIQDGQVFTSGFHTINYTLNLRLAKEIRRKLRLSISAFNVLNQAGYYTDPVTGNMIARNQPVSISAGINYKF